MIKNLVSILLISNKSEPNVKNIFENLKKQSHKSFEIFLISNDILYTCNFNSIMVPLLFNIKNSFDILLSSILSFVKGEFFSIMNYEDTYDNNRFTLQIEFLNTTDINICSTLISPIDKKNSLHISSANDSNRFFLAADIDFSVSSYYIPIDIYTLLIKTSFLKSISHLISANKLLTELDFILFFLRYSAIEKLQNIFYYFKICRIPYDENININNSINSTNKIANYIKNKYIQNRRFLSTSLNDINLLDSNIVHKYNILIIIENLCIGGSETYILSICKSLKSIGITPYILTFSGIFDDVFINNNIPILKYSDIFFKYRQGETTKFIHSLKKIIVSYNIKALYIHTPFELELACEYKKYNNIPIIFTLHGTYYEEKLIAKNLDSINHIISVSHAILNFYKDILLSYKNISIIQNSIQIKKPYSTKTLVCDELLLPYNSKLIVYCSRLSASKSHIALDFLKNFENLLSSNKNIYALITGDGTHYSTINSLATKINLKYGKKIFMLGFIFDVSKYYNASEFIIGTGRVALESLACNKPLLAYGLLGYSGIVSSKNINYMLKTNFSDHTSFLNKNIQVLTSLSNDMQLLLSDSFFYESIKTFSYNYCKSNLNSDISLNLITNIFDSLLLN